MRAPGMVYWDHHLVIRAPHTNRHIQRRLAQALDERIALKPADSFPLRTSPLSRRGEVSELT
jgi:hypothetical protein